jgi:hypothetical protein
MASITPGLLTGSAAAELNKIVEAVRALRALRVVSPLTLNWAGGTPVIAGMSVQALVDSLFADPVEIDVVTNVCPTKDEDGFVTGITVEKRTLTLPRGTTIGDAVCEDDPEDCCPPPVTTGCCPDDPVPQTLYLTFADSGTCPKFDGQTFELTYDAAPCTGSGEPAWLSADFEWDCYCGFSEFAWKFRFFCDTANNWALCIVPGGPVGQCQCDGRFGSFTLADGGVCSPFLQTFTADMTTAGGGWPGSGGCSGTEVCGNLSCTVTE